MLFRSGTIALNGFANFLHLKPALEAVRQGAENHQQASNRAMERIDAFVSEYHEAGKHLKNMCLALMGKEPRWNEAGQRHGKLICFGV